MSLKKLSFTLLAILSFNIHSMEEQDNETPGAEKLNKQAFIVESRKAEKLKFLCAQEILKDNLSTESLPGDLKDYLEHFNKQCELEKHNLALVFKKYLISCFDYLLLDELKDILQIIDKANEISEQKSMLFQKTIPSICKTVFCSSPSMTLIGLAANIFPNNFGINTLKMLEEINLEDLENDDLSLKERYSLALMNFAQSQSITSDSPCLKFIISSSKQGHAPSIHRLGIIKAATSGITHAIPCVKKLIELKALDDACELISLLLVLGNSPFSSEFEFLEREDFCNLLNNFIKMILDRNNYKSDYDLTLVFVYNYLNDTDKAIQHAEKCLEDNEGIVLDPLCKLLRDAYKQKGDIEKEEFYSNKIQEFEDIRNS